MAELSITGKISKVLGNPSEFFAAVKGDKGVGPAFKYNAVISLVPTVIIAIFLVAAASLLSGLLLPLMALGPIGNIITILGIGLVVAIYVTSLLAPFVSAAVLHAFAYIFGARGGYGQTYKTTIYGGTPAVLLGWIPFIGFIFSFWSIYLYIKGLSTLHGISMGRAAGAVILPLIIVVVLIMAVMIWTVVSMMPPFGPSLPVEFK